MNWETLLAFGDSITFGARSYLAYPEICGNLLEQKLAKNWHVINHATNGFTTMDLLRSINTELTNYKQSYPSLITVMIGTNDIKAKISKEEFKIAYSQLIVKLRLLAVNNNIILLKIPKFTKQVFYPYNFAMNAQIDEFNACIQSLGTLHNLRCFEFIFEETDFFDGVHLNSKGSLTAAIQLSELILKDKGFESSSTLS